MTVEEMKKWYVEFLKRREVDQEQDVPLEAVQKEEKE